MIVFGIYSNGHWLVLDGEKKGWWVPDLSGPCLTQSHNSAVDSVLRNCGTIREFDLTEKKADEDGQAADVAKAALDSMTDDDRLEVIRSYCVHCGSRNPECQCWNDD